MSREHPVNVGASVRQRLLNLAKTERRPFIEVLQYFAMERFLFRLGCTQYVDRLTLKGAALLRVWGISLPRATRDIDFLGRLDGSPQQLLEVVREILAVPVEDGIVFDLDSLEAKVITEDAAYEGVRATVRGSLAGALFKLQLDVGIGDVMVPEPCWVEYPQLLDLGGPRVQAYQPETSIAEKFQAMVELDLTNSRMKDFYDIWLLRRSLEIDAEKLAAAIRATFRHRRTPIPTTPPTALTDRFALDEVKRLQWRAFLRKLAADDLHLHEVIEDIRPLLMDAAAAAAAAAAGDDDDHVVVEEDDEE